MYSLPAEFLRALTEKERFPPDFLTRDPAELREYGKDWTRAYEPAPSAVAFPRSTGEVAQLLRLCHEHDVKVVPSGGRTGLAGGAVAARGELVLSLQRMARIGEVDPLALTVRVQAGAVTQAVHRHCEEHGLTWPIDLAAKGSCQIGGNIATNAGGVKVIRYGATRNWVLGLEVVTAQGQVLELNGALEKNNTGYDLRQLFIGSEGTLGVVTEATLKLTRVPAELDVFLFAVLDLGGVLRLFQKARTGPFTIMAFEFMSRESVERVTAHRKLRWPYAQGESRAAGYHVLLEVERPSRREVPDVVEGWLGVVLEEGGVLDGVLGQNGREAQELWALREGITEALGKTGLVHKNDVALPISALAGFCAELQRFFAARYPAWEIYLFGHIGDGNLHINVLKPEGMDAAAFFNRAREVDRDLFGLVQKYHGSISAEHGIGLVKKDYLSYTRTPAEIEIFKSIKRALDPKGILNPGKIFDL